MTSTGHKNRSIKRLHLDLRNPRLGRPAVNTEPEAMSRLLNEFGPKIISLARSIAEHGLNPTESWAIVHEEGKYVVLEGNRRLVACRLLENPGKAPDPETTATFERIKKGARTATSYLNPSCVEFEHRSDARYWIHLKHHGAGSGEGIAAWGPEMVYLDQVNSGSSSPMEWNEFWYWLEETYRHDRSLIDLIDRARHDQYTLMERVYTWKAKELLGARFVEPSKITVNVDPDKIKPFISKLIAGMLTSQPKGSGNPNGTNIPVISSRTLNSKSAAETIIDNVWRDTIGHADVTPKTAPSDSAADTSSSAQNAGAAAPPSNSSDTGVVDDPTTETTGEQKEVNSGGYSRTRQPKPRKSATHLYHGVKRNHMPDRLKELLKECGRLEIAAAPETASVMARVAIELAVDALIEQRGLQPSGNRLVDKLSSVMRHLDPRLDAKNPTRPDLAGTWAAIRTDTADGNFIRDLHNCVHSFQFTAALEMAERANRLFTPLLNAIGNNLGTAPDHGALKSTQNG